ncbi:MAG: imidazole glycerol phosphate synthase cyclase subunit [Chlorobium phaeovibrioides]|nr:imidazole glycerol phosphate synthase cyclase subunit [Chlorobium phaeovibrioides]
MLKRRIVATLVVKDGIVVQSIGFKRYLPVGQPAIAVEFLNQWGIDEIILLDISASRNGRAPDFAMVRSAASLCRVPLTVGGGITRIEHITELMHCGADKVSINQAALFNPELLTDAAHQFGDQCIVASIDGLLTDKGYRVYNYLQSKVLDRTPAEQAVQLQQFGTGEILINSVDRDGSYLGFDLDLIDSVCSVVTVPVICSGGAGDAQHFIEVFKHTHASAASAANFFHFSEHSVTTVKAQVSHNCPVRHETWFNYLGTRFDDHGRLLKKEDRELEEMLFLRIEKDVI